MSHFCLLRDPKTYVAHDWDLLADHDNRKHWLEMFQKHFQEVLKHATELFGRSKGKQIGIARQQFDEAIESLRSKPDSLPTGRLDIIELCRLREKILRQNRLDDPFAHVKTREINSAIDMYPEVVRTFHVMPADQKWLHLVRSVFAGNIFDLGSPMVMGFSNHSVDFFKTLEGIKPRPWLVDDYDRLGAALSSAPPTPWAKAVIFVDNSGGDFILGVLPLARELALCGTRIVLAANELPSLNDITADETVQVMQQLAGADSDLEALLAAGMFEVVSTGNDIPLIDLSNVSDELNEAAADADLIILEGMGRAIESNFDAAFKADCLRMALLKDARVAARIGGGMYDCVCKYTPAAN